jgi:hypothetical protein
MQLLQNKRERKKRVVNLEEWILLNLQKRKLMNTALVNSLNEYFASQPIERAWLFGSYAWPSAIHPSQHHNKSRRTIGCECEDGEGWMRKSNKLLMLFTGYRQV